MRIGDRGVGAAPSVRGLGRWRCCRGFALLTGHRKAWLEEEVLTRFQVLQAQVPDQRVVHRVLCCIPMVGMYPVFVALVYPRALLSPHWKWRIG